MSEKKQIKISTVIDLLDEGKTRAEIKEQLELSSAELKYLFEHPKLKGKKPRKALGIEVVDDVAGEQPQAQEERTGVESTTTSAPEPEEANSESLESSESAGELDSF